MDKKELNDRLVAVVNALNTVEVRGAQNLAALGGSLRVLSEILEAQMAVEDES